MALLVDRLEICPWESDEEDSYSMAQINELRFSVESLLKAGERMSVVEITEEILQRMNGGKPPKAWAVDVIKDIFNEFGLEFQNAMYDEVTTPRWSVVEGSIVEQVILEEAAEEPLPEIPQEFQQLSKHESMAEGEQPEEEHVVEKLRIPELPHLISEDDSSDLEPQKWVTPPHSPKPSVEEACCIPFNPKRFSRSLPTPPTSPRHSFSKPRPSNERALSEKPPSPVATPLSSRSTTSSIIHRLRQRFLRKAKSPTISEIEQVQPAPSYVPLSPSPPPPPSLRPASVITKASHEDIQAVIHGPTLKLNRFSGISVPLTPEECEEIARRRAQHSSGEEDFDLVVRLGTLRTASGMSTTSSIMGEYIPHAPESTDIPSVPMIDAQYLSAPSKTTSVQSSGGIHRSGSRKIRRRPGRRLRIRRSLSQQTNDNNAPATPEPGPRHVLSEHNLRLLNESLGTLPPPIPTIPLPPTPSIQRHPSKNSQAYLPSEGSTNYTSRFLPVPAPPVGTAARRRSFQRMSSGRRLPSMDHFPPVRTTALGMRGGRIGLVQMGSAVKANKILGDVVLLVPEKEAVKKRRVRNKDLSPTRRASRTSLMEIPLPQANVVRGGSARKVEKLRGEKVPVESLSGTNRYIRPKSNGAVWII